MKLATLQKIALAINREHKPPIMKAQIEYRRSRRRGRTQQISLTIYCVCRQERRGACSTSAASFLATHTRRWVICHMARPLVPLASRGTHRGSDSLCFKYAPLLSCEWRFVGGQDAERFRVASRPLMQLWRHRIVRPVAECGVFAQRGRNHAVSSFDAKCDPLGKHRCIHHAGNHPSAYAL